MTPQFDAIAQSRDNAATKGLRYAAVAGTIAQRTLISIVPSGAHLIYLSLQGYCGLMGLFGERAGKAANQCINTLKHADTLVQTTFTQVTDTTNQANAIQWIVNLNMRKR